MNAARRIGVWGLFAGGVVLAALQSILLRDSLWHDEVFLSSLFLGDWFSTLCTSVMRDHFPAYYFVQRVWIAGFGDSELSMRALPVLSSWLLPAALWRLSSRLLSPGYRALLVGLVIFNPAYLYFSTEARSYMPAAACVVIAAALYFEPKKPFALPIYAATMGLAVFSHPYLVASLLPFLFLSVRDRRSGYAVVNGALLAGWAVFVSFKLRVVGIPDDMVYLERISLRGVYDALFSWLVHGRSLLSGAAALKPVYAALFLFGFLGLAAARCETALKRTVLCLTVAPLFLIALLSFVIPKSFVERAIFSGYPFFWCVVVFGISRIRSAAVRRGLAALVAGVAVLATFAFLAEKDSLVTVASPKNDWRGVTEFLARRGALDGAESCVLSDIPLVGVRYYLKRRGLPVGDPIAYQRKIMREKIAAVFPGGAARSAEPPKEPPIYQVTGASALRELVAGHRDFYLIRDPVRSRNYRKIQNGLAASGLIDYDRTYCFKGVEIDVFHRKKT